MKLEHYADEEPQLDLQAYFTGPIKAWGLVQDWRGRVVNRFDVTMYGTWNGDVGTLEEHFVYYGTGKTQKRVWTITKVADKRFTGTAGDIIGTADGEARGNAVRWTYTMDLEVGDTHYKIKFDDWMWQMNDGVLINRSYLKKFGITVAELSLFMQKQPESAPSNEPQH